MRGTDREEEIQSDMYFCRGSTVDRIVESCKPDGTGSRGPYDGIGVKKNSET